MERAALELVPREASALRARDPVPEARQQAFVRLRADGLEHERSLARAVEADRRDAVLGDGRLDAEVADRREDERLRAGRGHRRARRDGGRGSGARRLLAREGGDREGDREEHRNGDPEHEPARPRLRPPPMGAQPGGVSRAGSRAHERDRSKVASVRPASRTCPLYDHPHGRIRPDDHDPALGPARRTAGSPRSHVPARVDARARPLPLPDRVGDRVHAQPARSRSDEPEAAARDRRHDRLPAVRGGGRCGADRDRRRRVRPGPERGRPSRRVRDGGAAGHGPDRRRAGHRRAPAVARRPRAREHRGPRADQRVDRRARRRRDLRLRDRRRSSSSRGRRSRSCSSSSR